MICFFLQTELMATELNAEDGILPSHSTEYVRTLNRNASTDADAAFYNPAGLAMLDKTGLYINFSSQTLHKKRTHTLDYHTIAVDGNMYAMSGLIDDDYSYEGDTANISPDFYTNMPMSGVDDPTSRFAEVYAPVMPDLNIIYKADRWAGFFSVGIMQAAPEFTFGRGLATTDFGILSVAEQLNAVSNETAGGSTLNSLTWKTNQVVRTEYYVAGTIGGAYRIFEMLSASAAFRYIYYMGGQKIKITGVEADFDNSYLGNNVPQSLWDANSNDWDIDTSYTGQSYGFIIGTDIRPIKSLNIGVRYEYYLPAELKKKTNSFEVNPLLEATGLLNIFKDGSANDAYNGGEGYAAGNGSSILKVTYPQSISMGISWQLLKSLRLEVDGDVYLKNKVDLDGGEKDFNTAYRVGGCVEYSINDKMVASIGYSYNDTGIKNECRNEIDPLLLNHTIGTGVGITVNDRLSVNMGLCYIYYLTAKVEGSQNTYSEMEVPVTVGLITANADVTTNATSYYTKELAEETFMVSFGATYRIGGGDSSFKDDKEDDVKSAKKDKKKDKKIKKDDKKQG